MFADVCECDDSLFLNDSYRYIIYFIIITQSSLRDVDMCV